MILMDALQVMVRGGRRARRRKHVKQAQNMINRMKEERGYCDHCVKEGVTSWSRHRYA